LNEWEARAQLVKNLSLSRGLRSVDTTSDFAFSYDEHKFARSCHLFSFGKSMFLGVASDHVLKRNSRR
jgi:hypothetical protein